MTNLISNSDARRIFLAKQGLSAPPNKALTKAGLLELIHELGFVQVDSIQTVERAHHQILFSRNQTYKREHLTALLEKDGSLFEHWTHDASILPSAFFRYWKHKFRHEEEVIGERWRKWQGEGFEHAFDETFERVTRDGAIMAREIKADGHVSGGWWNWHPNKTALEYFWRTGKFAIAGRSNFQKIYDLVERVIPPEFHEPEVTYEDPAGIRKDMGAAEVLERFGPPALTLTTGPGEEVFSYTRKDTALDVTMRNGKVAVVRRADGTE